MVQREETPDFEEAIYWSEERWARLLVAIYMRGEWVVSRLMTLEQKTKRQEDPSEAQKFVVASCVVDLSMIQYRAFIAVCHAASSFDRKFIR